MTTTPDGRPVPAPHADERTVLEGWLDFHRATLTLKCAGLDDSQVRQRSVEPSSMSLLGLVQHMAEVERNWFQRIFAGLDVPQLYELEQDGSAPEGGMQGGAGFTLSPEHGMDEATAVWHREVERGRELTAEASLDDSGTLPDGYAGLLGDDSVSLRWILVHLIEEYARHNGHADLLRERIDGTSGS